MFNINCQWCRGHVLLSVKSILSQHLSPRLNAKQLAEEVAEEEEEEEVDVGTQPYA